VQMTAPRVAGAESSPLQAAQDVILVIRRKDLERRRAAAHAELPRAEGRAREQLQAECAQLSVDIHKLRQGWATAKLLLEL
jgi:F0F1-type ATP synthase membrane subunit b/b'